MSEPIAIPELGLVALIGVSGSGKSTFARQHFKPTEVLSSDTCRGWVSDSDTDQSATDDAFAVLQTIANKRLARGLLTVVDATNVQHFGRGELLNLARAHHVFAIAIVCDVPLDLCLERNAARTDRQVPEQAIRRQYKELRRSVAGLRKEGFRYVFVLDSAQAMADAQLTRTPLWTNRKQDHGPFDIIGDIHGCQDELTLLLGKLGYAVMDRDGQQVFVHPEGRRALFLGDLCDRGPATPGVYRLVMAMVQHGMALCVPGNHDTKLLKWMQGRNVKLTHGLAQSVEQFALEPDAFKAQVASFIDKLISHLVLDDGRLVVAHAGLKQAMQGRSSGAVREFCLYGETTGEIDAYGLPVRANWAADYRSSAMVVHGHTPVVTPAWLNNTLCVDTGCVFGGALTALRYPERELVSVPAARVYCEPMRPVAAPAELVSDQLDLDDVLGRRAIATRLGITVTINERDAANGLEAMSRFAVDPRWLVYLPPTMSPCETAPATEPLLEHPREALAYFRSQAVPVVVCQEKHMGSRAVVVLCQDGAAALAAFGIDNPGHGVVLTRSGRPFFGDAALEAALLDRLRQACATAGLWQELQTNWLIFDAELLPWSAKAQELLRRQYASTGAAGVAGLQGAVAALQRVDTDAGRALLLHYRQRLDSVQKYVTAYRQYCWPVAGLDDLKLAPFHLLASHGAVHTDKDHLWHMAVAERLAAAEPRLVQATRYLQVDPADPASCQRAIDWWQLLTDAGGEGMVVKPLQWMTQGPKGLVQPAVKCRGPEYLRIIYGPEYALPQHLERLRSRGLGSKRALAMREFALGIEGLQRFVGGAPLRQVHECVFGVLALESEALDPRL